MNVDPVYDGRRADGKKKMAELFTTRRDLLVVTLGESDVPKGRGEIKQQELVINEHRHLQRADCERV